MPWDKAFESAFNPRSIAVVGATRDLASGDKFGRGSRFIVLLRKMGYRGRIYPVNPSASNILGLQVFPSVSAIPDQVDLVIVAVRAGLVPSVLEDCAKANAKNIHVFSAGFAETGTGEGILLEEKVKQVADKHGLRVLGPNCMGVAYVPGSSLGTIDFCRPDVHGPVGFVSQSGGLCSKFLLVAENMDIKFSKMVSVGNSAVMDATDILEYLAADPETRVICMYLEGLRNGGRLLSLVREANLRKPVIIWKPGVSEEGARAVRSHTGSLVGSVNAWNAFFRQTGAVRVNSMEEMADVAATILHMDGLPAGKNIAIVGAGGGNSVIATEMCAAAGLHVPELTPATIARIRESLSNEGRILGNPIDLGTSYTDPAILERCLCAVADDPKIEMMVVSLSLFALSQAATLERSMGKVVSLGRRWGKPVGAVVTSAIQGLEANRIQQQLKVGLRHPGIGVYEDFGRAVHALARFAEYHAFLSEAKAERGARCLSA